MEFTGHDMSGFTFADANSYLAGHDWKDLRTNRHIDNLVGSPRSIQKQLESRIVSQPVSRYRRNVTRPGMTNRLTLLGHELLVAIIILQERQPLLVKAPAIRLETRSSRYPGKSLCYPFHKLCTVSDPFDPSSGRKTTTAPISSRARNSHSWNSRVKPNTVLCPCIASTRS